MKHTFLINRISFFGFVIIQMILGNGDGAFQNQMMYEVGLDSCFINVGDFNNDGKLDLVVANSNI